MEPKHDLGTPGATVNLLRHDSVLFEDQTVYASGHAYFACDFKKCTMVLTGQPFQFQGCRFEGCLWHVNILLHDPRQADDLLTMLSQVVVTLPRAVIVPATATAAPNTPESAHVSLPMFVLAFSPQPGQ